MLTADDNVAYHRLRENGQALMAGLREAASGAGHDALIQGPGPMFHMGFTSASGVHDYREAATSYDGAKYARFELGMLNEGVRLIGRGIWYHSVVHTSADVDKAIDAATKVLKQL